MNKSDKNVNVSIINNIEVHYENYEDNNEEIEESNWFDESGEINFY